MPSHSSCQSHSKQFQIGKIATARCLFWFIVSGFELLWNVFICIQIAQAVIARDCLGIKLGWYSEKTKDEITSTNWKSSIDKNSKWSKVGTVV